MTLQAPGDVPENVVAIVAIFTIFVICPLVIAVARLIWRRAASPPPRPINSEETNQRLIQMQQSIDAMAIELERISEGQRFVTKLMADKPASAKLGASVSERS